MCVCVCARACVVFGDTVHPSNQGCQSDLLKRDGAKLYCSGGIYTLCRRRQDILTPQRQTHTRCPIDDPLHATGARVACVSTRLASAGRMCWSRGPLPVVRSDCGSVPEFKGLRESGAPASLMFRKPPWAVRVADSDLDASPSSRPAPRWPRPGHGERDARRCWRAPAQECTARSAGLGRSSGGGREHLGSQWRRVTRR